MTETWRRLGFEQRVAAVGAVLLIISAIGPFSLVELAVVMIGAAVLWLLKQRSEGRDFHLPFGDGTVIMAAGLWAGVLIVVRLFDRPLGQSVLALGCAAIIAGAGARERATRPADDISERSRPRPEVPAVEIAPRGPAPDEDPTVWLDDGEAPTARLDEDTTVRRTGKGNRARGR